MKYGLLMVGPVPVPANGSADSVEEFDTDIAVELQYPVSKENLLDVLRSEEICGECTPNEEFNLVLRDFGMVDLYHKDVLICRLQRR